MWQATPLTERFALHLPIIQAPMAGGPTTPELVAAVSNAGGLGTLALGYLTPAQARAAIRRVKELTVLPFGVNLLIAGEAIAATDRPDHTRQLVNLYRAELELGPVDPPTAAADDLDDLVAVVLEEDVPIVSFAFGIPSPEILRALERQGATIFGTATTVAEAEALVEAGAAFIVAQGAEAGGHRGTFLGSFEAALVGTMALVPQIVDAVDVPVIAAGGIMDGRGIAAALALGAAGVQLGTAFLAAAESGANDTFRQALADSTETSTRITRSFTGKPVRALENRFVREMRGFEREVPAYPLQHALTRELRRKAAALGNPDFMGMWAGQGTRLLRAGSAAELMAVWVEQTDEVFKRLGR